MLSKVMKYEWKATSKILLILHGALAAYGILCAVTLSSFVDIVSVNWSGLLFTLYVIFVLAAGLFTILVPAIRYYRSMYHEEGYLTHSVPVTSYTLVTGRLLNALIWYVIDLAIISLTTFVILVGVLHEPRFITEAFEWIGDGVVSFADSAGVPVEIFAVFLIILISASFIFSLFTVYLSIALGSLVKEHRVAMSIAFYFGLHMAYNVFTTIYGILLSQIEGSLYNVSRRLSIFSSGTSGVFAKYFFHMLIGYSIFFIIGSVAYYFIIVRIDEKKLNLQ
uniref:hypothetical protein n=1 Tax=Eubacterium cellulosolvens TaxID=29322 RepID=UPI000480C07F|nr:hypothetical protein [[Eubacterium] cellulosolvens]